MSLKSVTKATSFLPAFFPRVTALAMLFSISGVVAETANDTAARPQQSQSLKTVKVSADVIPADATAREAGYRPTGSSTSGFREKAVIDTPFSVASFSAEVVRDQQAKSVLDITKNDPSISQSSSPMWFDRISVRGFGLSVDAVQRDGLSINDQGKIALENKAAVEIAKGLSALRYGMTSPGGVLNYVVKRPTDEPLAQVIVSGNGFGGRGVHADAGGRFGEANQFGVRVNAAKEDVQNHIDEMSGDKTFFSTFFDWQLSEKLLVELDFEYQEREMTASSTPSISWFGSLAEARAFFPRLNAKTFANETWAMEPNEQTYFAGHIHYQLTENWRASLSAQEARLWRHQNSVRPVSIQPNGDYSASLYYSPDQERNNSALKAVVEGDFQTGVLKHELAFGYEVIERDMTWPVGFSGVIGTNNLFNPTPVPNPRLPSDPSYLGNRTEQPSIFIADTVSYADWLQVFGGLRETQIDQYSGEPSGLLTQTYDKSAVTPTVGIVVKPQPALSLYSSYAEGIEMGGTAPTTAVNSGEVMGPLESEQYEVGVKYELSNGALLTAAIFQIDKGLQYLDGPSNRYVQDGRQVHQGVEITLGGQLTSNLRVIAGAAYLEAEIEKTGNLALIGKRPQGVPEWQANLFADYNFSEFVNGLSANAGVYYSGEKAIDNLSTWMADSYVRLDAGLRYQHQISSSLVTYRFNIENITDERYLSGTTFGALDFGATRTLKASVEFAF